MLNLKPYPDSSKDLFTKAVQRKEDLDLRNRLMAIKGLIEEQYDVYDRMYKQKNLVSMSPNPAFGINKMDILSLYDYNGKTMRELRESISLQQPACIRYTCQNCTLTENESLDHYLPKEEFPEFAIHSLNLIPSCKTCNGYKSYVWRQNSKLLFINHYLDDIPAVRYLFVDVVEASSELDFSFYLTNLNGIAADKFKVIESHFKRLRLFERMRKKSVSVISELEHSIEGTLQKLSMSDCIDIVKSSARRNMESYGQNYWKSVVELALVESPVFLKRF